MPSIIKIQDNNIDKIVSVNGQILQAPVSAGDEAIYTINASKGTVSSNTISVTPSLTVTSAGLVSAGTEQSTPVTVSASELVNGTKSITENGTGIDVTNYASVDVAVSSSGGADGYRKATIAISNDHTSSISFTNLLGRPKLIAILLYSYDSYPSRMFYYIGGGYSEQGEETTVYGDTSSQVRVPITVTRTSNSLSLSWDSSTYDDAGFSTGTTYHLYYSY